jgi:hypothetical protein
LSFYPIFLISLLFLFFVWRIATLTWQAAEDIINYVYTHKKKEEVFFRKKIRRIYFGGRKIRSRKSAITYISVEITYFILYVYIIKKKGNLFSVEITYYILYVYTIEKKRNLFSVENTSYLLSRAYIFRIFRTFFLCTRLVLRFYFCGCIFLRYFSFFLIRENAQKKCAHEN